jgi:hypothetical protein
MNIAIGSLNYDIILQVERMLFEHEKLSLFISCHFWLSGGCRSCAIAWGSESLIPVKEEEIGKVFTLFVKLTLPFQVVSMWMVRAISQQNGEPELHPREVPARRPSSFVDDLPFVFLQFLYVSREDCLLLICAIV